MKWIISLCASVLIAAFTAGTVSAQGVAAGTVIFNTATVSYVAESVSYVRNSNVEQFAVQEIIDFNLIWQDATNVVVPRGTVNQVLTFQLTNTGNGSETFNLSADSTLGTGDFDPTMVGIFADTNGNGSYDSGTDLATANYTLAPDASIILFLLNDIPSGLLAGDIGNSQLTAVSSTGTGAPGTLVVNGGDGGVIDAIIGSSGGSASVSATYAISDTMVNITKSAIVTDQLGGNNPYSGATISYTLTVLVTGAVTVENIVITDLIPANTTYIANSLTLDGVALSDGADADSGDVGVTTAGTVTVLLGDIIGGSPAKIITFDVTIN